ncbi:MAG: glycine--tRNA ligase subunit beta [Candidatus Omnitrophica bacterium]|nr:glycine--tRNA ligase subunit beta [Candidatus Omnitrophota bacterium]
MKRNIKTSGRASPPESDFVLEIGCEELPADYLSAVINVLPGDAAGLLSRSDGFVWRSLEAYGGPRRLVLLVRGLNSVVRWERVGPSKASAYDAQGGFTQAAIGFAKSQGLPVSKLKLKETPRGPCLVAEQTAPAAAKLSKIIPALIQQIHFPKRMRWDAAGATFARPIRWLVALYGARIVPCRIAGVAGGRRTAAPRRARTPWLTVPSASAYATVLQRAGIHLERSGTATVDANGDVSVSGAARASKRSELHDQLRAQARKAGGRLPIDDEEFKTLLTANVFLAECPVVALGSFRQDYLTLPPEVLSASMAKHLKVFSLRGADGKFLPKFMAVLEGKPPKPAVVMGNYERILEARFADAQFFWKEDTKTTLGRKAAQLKQVIFHKQLGTLEEKSTRLKSLLEKSPISDAALRASIARAIELSKADLVTQMVREFPTLQGIVGGEHARHDGESQEVALAIREQYQPRSASDAVPNSAAGAWLSLLDKVDTLAGFFGVDLAPTSSADPYGLRRQALGIVRILVEKRIPVSLDALWEAAIESWGPTIKLPAGQTQEQLTSFVLDRFRWLVCEQREYSRELFDAVAAASTDNLADAWDRLEQLNQMWKDPKRRAQELFPAGKVMERTGRIVASANRSDSSGEVDPQKFVAPEERALWESWQAAEPEISNLIQAKAYQKVVKTYGALSPTVHSFFEKVFVMDPDVSIKQNRLALMYQIYQPLASHVADLSKLPLPKDLG